MGIIAWPDGMYTNGLAECAICGCEKSLADLSAGMVDAQGVQRFACNEHFWHDAQLLHGWTDFALRQIATVNDARTSSKREAYDEPSVH